MNPVTEIVLGPHAHLDHTTLQEESPEALHVGTAEAHLGPGAQLFGHVFSAGGALVRNELTVRIHGDGAGATLDGLFLARGEQHVDNHTLVDHARPHGGSQQYYKGILDGSARGAFDGRVIVRPAAAFTDAHQKNRNLLLSDTARIDAKPQLEIYNNDVKCTHGSATGTARRRRPLLPPLARLLRRAGTERPDARLRERDRRPRPARAAPGPPDRARPRLALRRAPGRHDEHDRRRGRTRPSTSPT